jgi:hypothetical protein
MFDPARNARGIERVYDGLLESHAESTDEAADLSAASARR